MENNKDIYSVSRLNTEVRQVLEGSFPLVWVEGEISGLSTPRSGHMYFSLKDEHAQTRCAMFRMKRQLLRFLPQDGSKVLVRARITLYEARGEFQLVVDHMEPYGEGQLRQAIERLKNQLDKEGLFAAEHKKDIPVMPSTVGVITSPTGAAIRDVLHVFNRRFPATNIIIYPVPVQGDNAAQEIVHMLKLADQRQECDLFILTRGGGSLEDLMAFNDEQLARTIFDLDTPIISAVGHEIDTSISDFVADRRAPTPSAAAELASPDQADIKRQIENVYKRLIHTVTLNLKQQKKHLDHLTTRLDTYSPAKQLVQKSQAVDLMEARLFQSMQARLNKLKKQQQSLQYRLEQNSPRAHLSLQQNRLYQLSLRLQQHHPKQLIGQKKTRLQERTARLYEKMQSMIGQNKNRLTLASRMLDSVSPLATLSRGYAVVRNDRNEVVRHFNQVNPGDRVSALLKDGELDCEVKGTRASSKSSD